MNLEQFTEKLDEYSAQDRELISRAFLFAQEAHQEQKRVSGEPFFNHPLNVALSLVELNLDAQTIAAALLHDVVEDTPITESQIKKEFGDDVSFLVAGVTKLEKIFYNPSKKHAENLRKMILAMAKDLRVVFIKLADRLHNMQTVSALTPEQQRAVAQETMEIYAPLASRLGIRKFRNQLEDLSFQYLYPQEFEWVKKISQPFIEKGGEYLEKLRPLVLHELKEAGLEPIKIDYRIKHFWSLYNKLLLWERDINKIFDIVAMRIILPTVGDCYMAMGIIHKLWRPVPGKIKDYISIPKPNGYQSLHTTVFCVDGKVTEFQIRTPQMQDEAEQGIAAHWFYEERGKKVKKYSKLPSRLTWVKQLQEWQSHGVNSKEFLESLRLDFFQNRIFVFTPRGDVIDLPQGATAIDFAYEIHSDIGNHCVGAKINGKMSPLDTPIKSQDVVEIIVNRSKKPSSSWLNFVKTTDAKSKIKSFLKKSSPSQSRKNINYELVVNAKDRVGLLHDISSVMAKEKINIKSISSQKNNRRATIYISLGPCKGKQEKVLEKIKRMKNIEKVICRPACR